MNKKTINAGVLVLSILSLLLIIAQLAVMCLPYINLLPIKVRERQDPPRDFSLQEFCWTETETMTKIFTQKIASGSGFDRTYTDGPHYIKGFQVNDFVMDLVLVNLFGIIAAIFLVFAIKNHVSGFHLGGAGLVKVLAAGFTALWGGWSIYAFNYGLYQYLGMLGKANYTNDYVPVICMIIAIPGLIAGLLSLVLIFVNRTRYKVVKPSMQ